MFKKRFLKIGSAAIAFALLMVISSSCSINDPEIPGWESRLKVFFRTDKVNMEEVLTESSLSDGYSNEYADTLIFVSISDTTEPQSIKPSDLAFKGDDDKISETVGVIELDDTDPIRTDPTSLADMVPEFNLQPGFILPPLSARTVTPPSHTISFTDFAEVQIDSAFMYIIFYNDLILEIDQGLKIRIFDALRAGDPDRGIIDSVTFTDAIPPGESAQSTPIDLSGKSISNQITLEYEVPIAATTDPITLTQDDIDSHFEVEVIIENLKVTRAIADVPEQRIEKNGATSIDTEDKSVNYAEIDNGAVNLVIQNYLQIDADLNVRILNIKNEFDEPKEINVFMPAAQTINEKIDISGYSISNHLNPGAAVDSIRYEIVALTQPSNGLVTIDSEDSIVVDISTDSTFVSFFEGSVSNLEIEIEPVEESDLADFSDFEGTFRLPDLVLTLTMFNEIDFEMNINLLIEGRNDDSGESVSINIDTVINRGTKDLPGKTVIQLNRNSSQPSIVDLMSILPTAIEISGNGFIDGQGSVAISDKVWANYTIDSPLRAIINEAIFVKTDIDSISSSDLNNDERQRITEDVRDVSIFINALNGLPLGTDFSFAISSDSTNLFDDQSDDSSRIVLMSTVLAGIKNQDGLVTQAKVSTSELNLTPAQLQLFNRSPLYYSAQLRVRPQTEPVLFRKNDEFSYDGYLDIRVKVDVEDE